MGLNKLKIIPKVRYNNAELNKYIIYKENKNKCGVYCWNNLVNGKSYVGSSTCLSNRFRHYYSLNYIKKKIKGRPSIIYNAILKYGYSNFSLDILEYCTIDIIIEREQYYIDILKPEYNILTTAGTNIGMKHTEKTNKLLSDISKGRKHSEDSKSKMRIAAKLRKGINTSMFGKNHTSDTKTKIREKLYVPVKITNINTGIEIFINGNLPAAKYLNISESTLRRYKKEGNILNGIYLISKK